jgi:hypothetical protein
MESVSISGIALVNNGKALDDDIRDHNQKALNKIMYELRKESGVPEDFFLNVGFTLLGFVLRHPGFWFDMDIVNRAIDNYIDETKEFTRNDVSGVFGTDVFKILSDNIEQMQIFAELRGKKPVEN